MDSKILKYFKKNHIQIEDIKYLTRVDGKTCIHTIDNQTFLTYITIKDFFESLELHDFICVNKGIVVAKSQINYIADGIYHMLDGAEFQGRKRTAAAHKKLNATLHQSIADSIETVVDIRNRFSILDNMPIAFCVIELIFNNDGHGIDFVFRYCNNEMAVIEGKTIEEMMNHSFFSVFPNADKKWLVAYTDVAVNGSSRYIRDYSPEINKEIFVRCFQPLEGFCACLLTPVDDLNKVLPAMHLPIC